MKDLPRVSDDMLNKIISRSNSDAQKYSKILPVKSLVPIAVSPDQAVIEVCLIVDGGDHPDGQILLPLTPPAAKMLANYLNQSVDQYLGQEQD